MRQGVGGQRIDHRAQRRRRIGSGGQRIAPDRQLAVGTGTARDDLAGMGHCRFAAEMIGILGHQGEDLLQQLGVVDDPADPEIDQPAVDAVALGAPAVLVDQGARIDPPAGGAGNS